MAFSQVLAIEDLRRGATSSRPLDNPCFHDLIMQMSLIDVRADRLPTRTSISVQVASSRSGFELVEDHQVPRLHRLEILGRDLWLRKGEIELGFDLEHQCDHIHRVQSDIHQPRLRLDIRLDRVLLEDALDDEKNTVLDAGIYVLHFNPTHRVTLHDRNRCDDS
jgi:hypothetical protein